MFGKKKTEIVNASNLNSNLREFLFDSQIDNAKEISVLLGATPISDELMEREQDESDSRVKEISFLLPLLYAYSNLIAKGLIQYQKDTMPEIFKTLPPEALSGTHKMLQEASLSTLIGALSQLVNLGYVEVPKKYRK